MAEEERFGSHEPFTIGVEEELFLVNPSTGVLLNDAQALIARVGELPHGRLHSELHASVVECITGVSAHVAGAMRELGKLRERLLGEGVGLIGSGTHPSALEGDAEITQTERYRLVRDLLGDAAATPVTALHVHVGMPDAETAIRVFNGLRRQLPLLEALGANSPFRHGRDTGFASSREITIRGWPRSGAPRAMADFGDFEASTARLTRVADVPDYTFHWWKLRPHPRLGTVEVRAPDVQVTPAHTKAIVALIQSLAHHGATTDESAPGPPPEILEEASYRAARSGVQATLPDATDALRPVAELADEVVELVRPHAQELGCETELDAVRALLEDGGGAGVQRAAHADGGIEGVTRMLLARGRET